MMSLVRKLVAGPKKKTPFNGNQLDLTHITDRIIAMAFPASTFLEKTYRNSIEDVANYFNQYHTDHYLIINVSSRSYDYSFFHNRVRDYLWPDHQAPPLATLIDIAHQIKTFLEKSACNVVAVHCNHGKGRTGTAIITFMLYVGFYEKTQEALEFYNQRRFNKQTYGVDQPCQVRYLNYVAQLKRMKGIPKKLVAYKLVNVTHNGLNEKCYLNIKQTRTGQTLYSKLKLNSYNTYSQKPLLSDIFIEILEETWGKPKKIARINYNTFFIVPAPYDEKTFEVVFKSCQIKLSKDSDVLFKIKLQFALFCQCHWNEFQVPECSCYSIRKVEENQWAKMIRHLNQTEFINFKEKGCFSYFYKQPEGIQKGIQNITLEERIYKLGHNMSNLDVSGQQPLGKIITHQSKQQQQKSCQLAKKEVEEWKRIGEMMKKATLIQEITSSSSQD